MIPCNALTLRHLGSLSILYVGVGWSLRCFVFSADGRPWGSNRPRTFAQHAACPIRGIYPANKQRNLVAHLTILTIFRSSLVIFFLSNLSPHQPFSRSCYPSQQTKKLSNPSSVLPFFRSSLPSYVPAFLPILRSFCSCIPSVLSILSSSFLPFFI
jgi:hypothetical protein